MFWGDYRVSSLKLSYTSGHFPFWSGNLGSHQLKTYYQSWRTVTFPMLATYLFCMPVRECSLFTWGGAGKLELGRGKLQQRRHFGVKLHPINRKHMASLFVSRLLCLFIYTAMVMGKSLAHFFKIFLVAPLMEEKLFLTWCSVAAWLYSHQV